jgi:hypothetical protein
VFVVLRITKMLFNLKFEAMKKLFKPCLIFVSIIIPLIIPGCEKTKILTSTEETPTLTDIVFTEKYLGVWSFKKVLSSWLKFPGRLPIKDSVYYIGVIDYDSKNDRFIIQYTENESLEARVEVDGDILNTCSCSLRCYCRGHFEGDSLFYYNKRSETLGFVNETYLTGKKISKTNYLANAPQAVTSNGTGSLTSVTLVGIVNPNFLITKVSFEFGESSNYDKTI